MGNIYGDIVGFDMEYDENEELCRQANKIEEVKNLYFDGSKKKIEEKNSSRNENRPILILEFTIKTKLFSKIYVFVFFI